MRVIATKGSHTFEINRANEIPATTYYLGVFTISGNLATFPLSIEIYKIPDIISKMNFPPIFNGQIQPSVEVSVNANFAGEVQADDGLEIIYTSPAAFDSEGDSITMTFHGLDLPFAAIKENDDKTFTLVIDKTKVTAADVGSTRLQINL